MSTLSASEIIKILAERNISIAVEDGRIGLLPKKHNLPSEIMESIRFNKTEIIRLLSSSQTNAEEGTPEFSDDEFAQVVDVFRLLRTQETKLRSIGQIGSINYREVDIRTDEIEKECSNSQVMESKPKTG